MPVTRIEGYPTSPDQAVTLTLVHKIHAIIEFNELRLNEPIEAGDVGRKLVIPPGEHTIKVRSAWSGDWHDLQGNPVPSHTYTTLAFTAVPRGEYRVHLQGSDHGTVDRNPRIVDTATDEIVSTLKLSSNSLEGKYELRFGQDPAMLNLQL